MTPKKLLKLLQEQIALLLNATQLEYDCLDVTDFGAVNGQECSAAIQAAINAARPGQTVYIPFGRYYIKVSLVIDKPIKLCGVRTITDRNDNDLGSNGSVLLLADDSNCDMIRVIDPTETRKGNVTICDLVLEGNKGRNIGHGITLATVSRVIIEDCRIRRVGGNGIHTMSLTSPGSGCNVCWIHRNEIVYCTGNGVHAASLGDSFISENTIGVCGKSGISTGGGNRLTDNHCYLNGTNGIAVTAVGSTLIGNKANNNKDGIRVYGAERVIVLGNQCFGNSNSDIMVADGTSTGKICANEGVLSLPPSHLMQVI